MAYTNNANPYDYIPSDIPVPALYSQENEEDPTVWVKLFTPDSSWTWYVLEYDPDERIGFAYVMGLDNELGYFSLDELKAACGPMGLHIERDMWFRPCPLSDVKSGKVR